MINLMLDNGAIVIDGKEDQRIFDWDHRSFFEIAAGYSLDDRSKRYLLSDRAHIHSVLLDTVQYLEEENISFSKDKAIEGLLRQIESEQKEYEQAASLVTEIQTPDRVSKRPAEFVRQLKTYQESALQHLLAVKHGANFSVPGSGKTSVIYAAFAQLRQEGIVEKLLVIGPRSCFLPWEEEAIACFGHPLRSARLTGSKITRQSLYLQSGQYEVMICTYQTASNDCDEIIDLCTKQKVFIVIDESHNIKRLEGGVWSEAMLRVSRYAVRRAILSGTPIPNDYTDLWTQLTFLWPGEQILGDRIAFRHRCEDESEVINIRRAVRPFIFRVPKRTLGLPRPEFQRHECQLSAYQTKIYEALSIKFLKDMNLQPSERQGLRQWRKAKMVRLIQTASNPTLLARYSEEFDVPPLSAEGASVLQLIDKYPQYEMPAKFQAAIDIVRGVLAQHEKVVIWTSFVHNIEMLKNLLKDVEPFVIYGAVPRDESEDYEFNREQQIQHFKQTSSPSVLIANPAACAESISLHKACHHAVYLDRTFNCGQYLQSLDRLHRVGLDQNETVYYHIVIASGTIDETIERRLREKEINMLHLLEDDLPVGELDAEDQQLGQSEDEEAIDFEETLKDVKHQVEANA